MQSPLPLQHSIIWRIPDDGLTFAVLVSIMKNHKGKAMQQTALACLLLKRMQISLLHRDHLSSKKKYINIPAAY